MNLYQQAKNLDISWIRSGDIVDIKMVQSDWLRAFWLISRKLDLSQIWDFQRNTAISITFH